MKLLAVISMLFLASPSLAQEVKTAVAKPLSICGLPFTNVYKLREAIEAKKLKPGNAKDGLTYFYAEPWAQRVWNLTRAKHPAHPSVVCFKSVVDKHTAKAELKTFVHCKAKDKAACDQHAKDLEAYNQKLFALIQKQYEAQKETDAP